MDRSGEEPPSHGRDYAERRIPVNPICKEFQITLGITTRAA